MKVSVIIPTYKPGDYLWECLDSVCSQTIRYCNYEVIIILNGCNQPYRSKIENYISQHRYVNFVFKQTNTSGVSNARNIGLTLANGDFISFIDDDDIISISYLEKLLAVSTDKCVGCSNSYSFTNNITNVSSNFLTKYYDKNKGQEYDLYKFRGFLSPPWGKLIHRDIISQCVFNTKLKYREDSVFCLSFSPRVSAMKLAESDAIYYVRNREGSATRRTLNIKDEVTQLALIVITYFKIWASNIFTINAIFVMNRIVAAFVHTFNRWILNYKLKS